MIFSLFFLSSKTPGSLPMPSLIPAALQNMSSDSVHQAIPLFLIYFCLLGSIQVPLPTRLEPTASELSWLSQFMQSPAGSAAPSSQLPGG